MQKLKKRVAIGFAFTVVLALGMGAAVLEAGAEPKSKPASTPKAKPKPKPAGRPKSRPKPSKGKPKHAATPPRRPARPRGAGQRAPWHTNGTSLVAQARGRRLAIYGRPRAKHA